ncbi:type VII secretion target [Nocardia harenae]|uniref:type VII secretion target n=1 Tax=Nocardia harenae TaxID=358707 RepID=UPI000837122F|nr:type VII secretion target [Nocardia harenae]
MTDLSVDTDGVRDFAATNAGVAGQIAGAGNFDAVANVSALTPVFGLIGADYLVMFAAAQVLQARDINDLSGKVGELSNSAFNAAAAFDGQEFASGAAIGGAL